MFVIPGARALLSTAYDVSLAGDSNGCMSGGKEEEPKETP
jgi:hypothetical protein